MIEWIVIMLVTLVFFAILSMGIAGMSFAPWVPTKKKDLQRVYNACNLRPGEVFMEIGCGNGRVSLFMHDNTDARIIGIERAWPLVVVCHVRKRLGRKKRFEIRHQNAFTADLSEANVIFTFGMPAVLKKKLTEALQRSCTPGTRIVSYVFPIETWTPDTVCKPSEHDLPIYTYTLT